MKPDHQRIYYQRNLNGYQEVCYKAPELKIYSDKELLKMQSKGKYLTPEEKKRVKAIAEERRKQKALAS